jgi:thioredoxin 1
MAEVLNLTDTDLDAVLAKQQPLLLVLTRSNDLRGDFVATLKQSAEITDDVIFAKIDADNHPDAAKRFEVGKKSVLIAYYRGNTLVRRSRPWGTDIPLTLEMLREAVQADPVQDVATEQTVKVNEENPIVDNAPVAVTDQNFQQEVIDHSKEVPVLVDFWAEWCGPCRAVAPVLDKLAKEYAGQIRIAKVNVDENPGLAQYFQVMSIPTIMILKNRTQVFSQPGAFPEAAFRDLINQVIDLEVPDPETETEQQEPSN